MLCNLVHTQMVSYLEQAHILVISNPTSGDGSGPQIVKNHIFPALHGQQYEYHETTRPGSAGTVAADFFQRHVQKLGSIVIIISGGDGTLHEVINGIGIPSTHVLIVLCPQGTANALYSTLFSLPPDQQELPLHYRLQSLQACIAGRSRPLRLTRTQILEQDGRIKETVLGAVVASAALHASILDTAEKLHRGISGIERFKVAAKQNICNWYRSHVKLSSESKIYDLNDGIFKPLKVTGSDDISISGPFAYFLSTVNVDRLEPAFAISPLSLLQPSHNDEMDLIIVRPLRDPLIYQESEESRRVFAQTLIHVLQAAYAEGSHINLKYNDMTTGPSENSHADLKGGGPQVVEYLRSRKWRWIPVCFFYSCFDPAPYVLVGYRGCESTYNLCRWNDTRGTREWLRSV